MLNNTVYDKKFDLTNKCRSGKLWNIFNFQAIIETESSEGNLDSSISHHVEYVAKSLRQRKPEEINET